jgi:hypothetical protein
LIQLAARALCPTSVYSTVCGLPTLLEPLYKRYDSQIVVSFQKTRKLSKRLHGIPCVVPIVDCLQLANNFADLAHFHSAASALSMAL